jgi:hypothetical protein
MHGRQNIKTKNVCSSEADGAGTMTAVPPSVGMTAANISPTFRLDHKN